MYLSKNENQEKKLPIAFGGINSEFHIITGTKFVIFSNLKYLLTHFRSTVRFIVLPYKKAHKVQLKGRDMRVLHIATCPFLSTSRFFHLYPWSSSLSPTSPFFSLSLLLNHQWRLSSLRSRSSPPPPPTTATTGERQRRPHQPPATGGRRCLAGRQIRTTFTIRKLSPADL